MKRNKNFDPYIVLDPEKNDLSSKGHFPQKEIFLTFSFSHSK
jgi:hypothetical protein